MAGEGGGQRECGRCRRKTAVCVCSHAPEAPLETGTRVLILQDPTEAKKRVIGTVPLIPVCIANCSVSVAPEFPPGMCGELDDLLRQGGGLLLFPGPRSVPLSEVAGGAAGRTLVVIDGTWRGARRLLGRSPRLSEAMEDGTLTMVHLDMPIDRGLEYGIRSEPNEESWSTLVAVAYALRELEAGDPDKAERVFESLIRVFRRMVELQSQHIPSTSRLQRPAESEDPAIPCQLDEMALALQEDPRLGSRSYPQRDDDVKREYVLCLMRRGRGQEGPGYEVVSRPFLSTLAVARLMRDEVNQGRRRGLRVNVLPADQAADQAGAG